MTIPYTFNRMGINAYAPPIDETDYLTFIANTSNSAVKLSKIGNPDNISLQYSKNKKNWRTYTIDDAIQLQSVGDKVYFRGNNNTLSKDNSNYYNFAMSGSINASGNVMSLLDKTATLSVIPSAYCFKSLFEEVEGYPHLAQAPTLPATTISDHCYASMFKNCANLIEMPELPAVTLDEHCYDMMFTNCISLTGYTTLPASALYSYCYSHMFRGCTSLSSAGTLEFTDFAQSTTNACDSMFRGCSSLVVAPAISAQNTSSYSYKNMFTDCSSLSSITVNFTAWENNATNDWVQNVASAGTFTCPDGLSAEYGDSRIPTNWNISHGEVPMPTSGLVFYWDMTDKNALSANTGQEKTFIGDIDNCLTNDVNSGLSCIYCENNSSYNYINFENPGIPYGDAERTVSIWANYKNDSSFTSTNGGLLMKYGPLSPEQYKWWVFAPYWIDSAYVSYNFTLTSDFSAYKWYNFIVTFSNGTLKLYVNGSLESQIDNCTIDSVSENLRLFGAAWGDDKTNEAWLTALRIYDRVLTQEEITTLASEFTQEGVITAEDLTTTFYQKDNSQGITYTSIYTPTFTIISGTLPNEISFDTSTGVFSGRAPTDADHQYNLVVRISAENSTSVDVNVTINTVAVARIYFYGSTINFTSEAVESEYIDVAYSDEPVTIAYYSGTMPSGVTYTDKYFASDGTQTASETRYVALKATSEHNQNGVIAEFTLNVNVNQLGLSDRTLKFYTDDGSTTAYLNYTTTNPITPVWSIISGTLPSGVTFDSTNGSFTSDGTQTADVSGTVGVQVASSTGCSTPASAEITLNIINDAQPIPTSGLVFYAPLSDSTATVDETGDYTLANAGFTSAVKDGVPCLSSYGEAGNSYVRTNSTAQAFGNSATWSMWFNYSTQYITWAGYQSSFNGGFRISFMPQNNIIELTMTGDSGYRRNIEVTDASTDTWHHVAISYDSNACKVYFDGVKVYEGEGASPLTSNNICFGGGFRWPTDIITKYIAAARIYDRVLTDAEIAQLAAEFTPTSN